MKLNPKLKNPVFLMSLVSIILAASGVDFESMTSWRLLIASLVDIIRNPVALASCAMAVYGIWNDNGTKGLDGFK